MKDGQRPRKPCIGVNQTSNEEVKFVSLNDAERATGCNKVSIQSVCDGVTNSVTSKTSHDIWIFKYIKP